MKTINFTKTAFQEYNSWRNENRKMQDRIADLIEDILRHPFEGIGKPEFEASQRFLEQTYK